MPPGARITKQDPDEPEWGVTEELMAQMVEVLSVFAADRRLAEPRVVPRPGDIASIEERQQERVSSHGGLMNAALMAGKVVAS